MSSQRMRLPPGRDARWAADEYVRWLGGALLGVICADVDADRSFRFRLRGSTTPLLALTHDAARSTGARQVFRVTGGLLADAASQSRFEFVVLDDGQLQTTVHDYAPSLPPWIYVLTQARVHEWVMAAFRRHLARSG